MKNEKYSAHTSIPNPSVTRRSFVRQSAAAAVTLGVFGASSERGVAKEYESTELSKRVLGRTGLEVTDIAFGGIQIQQARLLEAAIDRGINLVHTSPGYGGGVSIRLFGQVMKEKRDEVFLALKQDPVGGIDDSLKTLNTDYVDILIPGIHSTRDMNDAELEDAFGKLKEEGKIRFSGFAVHKNISDLINLAVDKGFFDVMMPAYNLGNRNDLDPLLARAGEEQNMGVMAMKTLRGLDKSDAAAVSAGFKSLLENPTVGSLLVGMSAFGEVERNVSVSGADMGWMDRARVRRFAYLSATACAGCGACEAACPRGVAVADIMRHKMYADRGERALAVSSYRRLSKQASLASCDHCGICEQACPRSRPVRSDLDAVRAMTA